MNKRIANNPLILQHSICLPQYHHYTHVSKHDVQFSGFQKPPYQLLDATSINMQRRYCQLLASLFPNETWHSSFMRKPAKTSALHKYTEVTNLFSDHPVQRFTVRCKNYQNSSASTVVVYAFNMIGQTIDGLACFYKVEPRLNHIFSLTGIPRECTRLNSFPWLMSNHWFTHTKWLNWWIMSLMASLNRTSKWKHLNHSQHQNFKSYE